MHPSELRGWVPIRVYWRESQPMVDWCFMGMRSLNAPFFDQVVEGCIQEPFNLLFRHQTPLAMLQEVQAFSPGLEPSGMIFHMSRCGSTLAAQLLTAVPGVGVVGEPRVIDEVLRLSLRDPGITDEQRVAWLRALVSVLGQPRFGQEQRFLVKFDCWQVLDLPLIRRAFPQVPWVFLYRDPVEVVVSQLGRPSGRMLRGPLEASLLGLGGAEVAQMSDAAFCAHALAAFCRVALEQSTDSLGCLLHYRELPSAVWASLAAHFAIPCTDADVAVLRERAQFDAKDRSRRFVDDSLSKQRVATDQMRALVDRWVGPWYGALEEVRVRRTAAVVG